MSLNLQGRDAGKGKVYKSTSKGQLVAVEGVATPGSISGGNVDDLEPKRISLPHCRGGKCSCIWR